MNYSRLEVQFRDISLNHSIQYIEGPAPRAGPHPYSFISSERVYPQQGGEYEVLGLGVALLGAGLFGVLMMCKGRIRT